MAGRSNLLPRFGRFHHANQGAGGRAELAEPEGRRLDDVGHCSGSIPGRAPQRERPIHLDQTRSARSGPVFDLGNLSDSTISHRVAKLAKAAGVVVHDSRGQERPAGCHDLRRSFGERWAQRVPPLVLMELMRHADIKTTLAYYVTADARRTSDLVWQFGANPGATEGDDKPPAK